MGTSACSASLGLGSTVILSAGTSTVACRELEMILPIHSRK